MKQEAVRVAARVRMSVGAIGPTGGSVRSDAHPVYSAHLAGCQYSSMRHSNQTVSIHWVNADLCFKRRYFRG
jgi:hypothetical protein